MIGPIAQFTPVIVLKTANLCCFGTYMWSATIMYNATYHILVVVLYLVHMQTLEAALLQTLATVLH